MLSQLAPSNNIVFSPSRSLVSQKKNDETIPALIPSQSHHSSRGYHHHNHFDEIASHQANNAPNAASTTPTHSSYTSPMTYQHSTQFISPLPTAQHSLNQHSHPQHLQQNSHAPSPLSISSSINDNITGPYVSSAPHNKYNQNNNNTTYDSTIPTNPSVNSFTSTIQNVDMNGLPILPPVPLPQFTDTYSNQHTPLLSSGFPSQMNNEIDPTPLATMSSNLSQYYYQQQQQQQQQYQQPDQPTIQPSPQNTTDEEYPDDQIVERALLEDSFIEHGLLAVDKNVSILGEIINLSEGRDKLFKLFSAVLKLIRYGITNWIPQTGTTAEIVRRINACSSAVSTTRLFLKLCTDWVFFRLAARVFYQQRSGTLKIFTLSRLLGMAFYFTCQWPIWLRATGLVKSIDKSFWQKLSLRSYIVSVCAQIFMDMRKAVDLTKEIGYWQLIVPGDALEQLESVHQCQEQLCQKKNNNENNNNNNQRPQSNQKQCSTNLNSALSTPPMSPTITTTETNSIAPCPNNNNNNNGLPSSPTTMGSSTAKSQPPNATLTTTMPPVVQQDVNPAYALSFQKRCTPTTARYQALLNRTIWEHQLQAQVAESQGIDYYQQQKQQQLQSSGQGGGVFSTLLSLPTTLNQGFNKFKDQFQGKQTSNSNNNKKNTTTTNINSPQSPHSPQAHPYIMARNQHDTFSSHLKQLQEETRLALVRENMLQKDRNKLFVNFIKDGGDLFGALDGLCDWGHSDLTLGLISLISGSISIYRMWARYKQTVEKAILEEARESLRKKTEEDDEKRRIEEDRVKLIQWADQVQQYYSILQQQQIQQQMQQYQDDFNSSHICDVTHPNHDHGIHPQTINVKQTAPTTQTTDMNIIDKSIIINDTPISPPPILSSSSSSPTPSSPHSQCEQHYPKQQQQQQQQQPPQHSPPTHILTHDPSRLSFTEDNTPTKAQEPITSLNNNDETIQAIDTSTHTTSPQSNDHHSNSNDTMNDEHNNNNAAPPNTDITTLPSDSPQQQ